MITYLTGKLAEKSPTRAVIDVVGIGYEVMIPLTCYDRLPEAGAQVTLLTHHHVREDGQTLFGFASEDDRVMFRRLLDVNGIGPRLALAVLSGLTVRELKNAIVKGDSKRLNGISGVGKKTAERIVIELKDKISDAEALEAAAGEPDELAGDHRIRDAVSALIALGYKQADAVARVRKVAETGGGDEVESLIRKALAG